MAQWVIFADRIVGQVEARTRDEALTTALRQYGQEFAVSRVQSLASYQLGLEERRVLEQRHRRPEW